MPIISEINESTDPVVLEQQQAESSETGTPLLYDGQTDALPSTYGWMEAYDSPSPNDMPGDPNESPSLWVDDPYSPGIKIRGRTDWRTIVGLNSPDYVDSYSGPDPTPLQPTPGVPYMESWEIRQGRNIREKYNHGGGLENLVEFHNYIWAGVGSEWDASDFMSPAPLIDVVSRVGPGLESIGVDAPDSAAWTRGSMMSEQTEERFTEKDRYGNTLRETPFLKLLEYGGYALNALGMGQDATVTQPSGSGEWAIRTALGVANPGLLAGYATARRFTADDTQTAMADPDRGYSILEVHGAYDAGQARRAGATQNLINAIFSPVTNAPMSLGWTESAGMPTGDMSSPATSPYETFAALPPEILGDIGGGQAGTSSGVTNEILRNVFQPIFFSPEYMGDLRGIRQSQQLPDGIDYDSLRPEQQEALKLTPLMGYGSSPFRLGQEADYSGWIQYVLNRDNWIVRLREEAVYYEQVADEILASPIETAASLYNDPDMYHKLAADSYAQADYLEGMTYLDAFDSMHSMTNEMYMSPFDPFIVFDILSIANKFTPAQQIDVNTAKLFSGPGGGPRTVINSLGESLPTPGSGVTVNSPFGVFKVNPNEPIDLSVLAAEGLEGFSDFTKIPGVRYTGPGGFPAVRSAAPPGNPDALLSDVEDLLLPGWGYDVTNEPHVYVPGGFEVHSLNAEQEAVAAAAAAERAKLTTVDPSYTNRRMAPWEKFFDSFRDIEGNYIDPLTGLPVDPVTGNLSRVAEEPEWMRNQGNLSWEPDVPGVATPPPSMLDINEPPDWYGAEELIYDDPGNIAGFSASGARVPGPLPQSVPAQPEFPKRFAQRGSWFTNPQLPIYAHPNAVAATRVPLGRYTELPEAVAGSILQTQLDQRVVGAINFSTEGSYPEQRRAFERIGDKFPRTYLAYTPEGFVPIQPTYGAFGRIETEYQVGRNTNPIFQGSIADDGTYQFASRDDEIAFARWLDNDAQNLPGGVGTLDVYNMPGGLEDIAPYSLEDSWESMNLIFNEPLSGEGLVSMEGGLGSSSSMKWFLSRIINDLFDSDTPPRMTPNVDYIEGLPDRGRFNFHTGNTSLTLEDIALHMREGFYTGDIVPDLSHTAGSYTGPGSGFTSHELPYPTVVPSHIDTSILVGRADPEFKKIYADAIAGNFTPVTPPSATLPESMRWDAALEEVGRGTQGSGMIPIDQIFNTYAEARIAESKKPIGFLDDGIERAAGGNRPMTEEEYDYYMSEGAFSRKTGDFYARRPNFYVDYSLPSYEKVPVEIPDSIRRYTDDPFPVNFPLEGDTVRSLGPDIFDPIARLIYDEDAFAREHFYVFDETGYLPNMDIAYELEAQDRLIAEQFASSGDTGPYYGYNVPKKQLGKDVVGAQRATSGSASSTPQSIVEQSTIDSFMRDDVVGSEEAAIMREIDAEELDSVSTYGPSYGDGDDWLIDSYESGGLEVDEVTSADSYGPSGPVARGGTPTDIWATHGEVGGITYDWSSPRSPANRINPWDYDIDLDNIYEHVEGWSPEENVASPKWLAGDLVPPGLNSAWIIDHPYLDPENLRATREVFEGPLSRGNIAAPPSAVSVGGNIRIGVGGDDVAQANRVPVTKAIEAALVRAGILEPSSGGLFYSVPNRRRARLLLNDPQPYDLNFRILNEDEMPDPWRWGDEAYASVDYPENFIPEDYWDELSLQEDAASAYDEGFWYDPEVSKRIWEDASFSELQGEEFIRYTHRYGDWGQEVAEDGSFGAKVKPLRERGGGQVGLQARFRPGSFASSVEEELSNAYGITYRSQGTGYGSGSAMSRAMAKDSDIGIVIADVAGNPNSRGAMLAEEMAAQSVPHIIIHPVTGEVVGGFGAGLIDDVLTSAGLPVRSSSRTVASASADPITRFRGDNYFLSNFSASPVTDDLGITYPTLEHAYQAQKSLDPSVREYVAGLGSPRDARSYGRRIDLRPDWDDVKLDTMDSLLRSKFEPGSDLAEQLLATGNVPLIEGNTWGDTYWGAVRQGDEFVGENNLGRLLSDIRSELDSDNLVTMGASLGIPSMSDVWNDPLNRIFHPGSIDPDHLMTSTAELLGQDIQNMSLPELDKGTGNPGLLTASGAAEKIRQPWEVLSSTLVDAANGSTEDLLFLNEALMTNPSSLIHGLDVTGYDQLEKLADSNNMFTLPAEILLNEEMMKGWELGPLLFDKMNQVRPSSFPSLFEITGVLSVPSPQNAGRPPVRALSPTFDTFEYQQDFSHLVAQAANDYYGVNDVTNIVGTIDSGYGKAKGFAKQAVAQTALSLNPPFMTVNAFNANVTLGIDRNWSMVTAEAEERWLRAQGGLLSRQIQDLTGEAFDTTHVMGAGYLFQTPMSNTADTALDYIDRIPGVGRMLGATDDRHNIISRAAAAGGDIWTGRTYVPGTGGRIPYGEGASSTRGYYTAARRYFNTVGPERFGADVNSAMSAGFINPHQGRSLVEDLTGIAGGEVSATGFAEEATDLLVNKYGLSPDVARDFVGRELTNSYSSVAAGSRVAGREAVIFALHEPGIETVAESALGNVTLFPKFNLATKAKSIKRLFSRPWLLNTYNRTDAALGEWNDTGEVRYDDTIPFGGGRVRVDINEVLFPFGNIFPNEIGMENAQGAQTLVDRAVSLFGSAGFQLAPWLKPLVGEDVNIGSVLPIATTAYHAFGLGAPQTPWAWDDQAFLYGMGTLGRPGEEYTLDRNINILANSGAISNDEHPANIIGAEAAYAASPKRAVGRFLEGILPDGALDSGLGKIVGDFLGVNDGHVEPDWLEEVSDEDKNEIISKSIGAHSWYRLAPEVTGITGFPWTPVSEDERQLIADREYARTILNMSNDPIFDENTQDNLLDHYVDYGSTHLGVKYYGIGWASGAPEQWYDEGQFNVYPTAVKYEHELWAKNQKSQEDMNFRPLPGYDPLMVTGDTYFTDDPVGPDRFTMQYFEGPYPEEADAWLSNMDVKLAENEAALVAGREYDSLGAEDLTVIDGIAAKTQLKFYEAGILTLDDVAAASIEELEAAGMSSQYSSDAAAQAASFSSLNSTGVLPQDAPAFVNDYYRSKAWEHIDENPMWSWTTEDGEVRHSGFNYVPGYGRFTPVGAISTTVGGMVLSDLPREITGQILDREPVTMDTVDMFDEYLKGIGDVTAPALATRFDSIEEVADATVNDITSIQYVNSAGDTRNITEGSAESAIASAQEHVKGGGIIRKPSKDEAVLYALVDPRNGIPFYVGQTTQNPAARLDQHMKEIYTKGTGHPKTAMIVGQLEEDWLPQMRILGYYPREEIDVWEQFYIGYYNFGPGNTWAREGARTGNVGGSKSSGDTLMPSQLQELMNYYDTDWQELDDMRAYWGTELLTPVTPGQLEAENPDAGDTFYDVKGVDDDLVESLNKAGIYTWLDVYMRGPVWIDENIKGFGPAKSARLFSKAMQNVNTNFVSISSTIYDLAPMSMVGRGTLSIASPLSEPEITGGTGPSSFARVPTSDVTAASSSGGTEFDLEFISGIGPKTEADIFAAGGTSWDAINAMGTEGLDAIKGVGPKTSADILAAAQGEGISAPVTTGDSESGEFDLEFISGIGPKTEADIFAAGGTSWQAIAAMGVEGLDAIKGVGSKTAEDILAAAGETGVSVTADVSGADEFDLEFISGIGPKTEADIFAAGGTSWQNILRMGTLGLDDVSGVGPKTAESIMDAARATGARLPIAYPDSEEAGGLSSAPTVLDVDPMKKAAPSRDLSGRSKTPVQKLGGGELLTSIPDFYKATSSEFSAFAGGHAPGYREGELAFPIHLMKDRDDLPAPTPAPTTASAAMSTEEFNKKYGYPDDFRPGVGVNYPPSYQPIIPPLLGGQRTPLSGWPSDILGDVPDRDVAYSPFNKFPFRKQPANEFREYIYDTYGFTESAQDLMDKNAPRFQIVDPSSRHISPGGGYWMPSQKMVSVNGPQHEAAVHELTHSYWHTVREDQPELRDAFVEDMLRLADDPNVAADNPARYISNIYKYGEGDWPGMYISEEKRWNDWEMFAGLASATMGDTSVMPDYIKKYFDPVFTGKTAGTLDRGEKPITYSPADFRFGNGVANDDAPSNNSRDDESIVERISQMVLESIANVVSGVH